MSTTTVRVKASQISKDWQVIDAADRPLGRVAAEAAALLRGKHKPTFEPHLDDGDFVIIINAAKVRLSGNKEQQVRYYRHSGYPGGLKTRTHSEQMEKSPERVIEKAVWGMLPGGALGKQMLRHLKVYKRADHPHQSQITGSERAAAARAEALKATLTESRKPRRLAPLPVPDPVKMPAGVVAAPAAKSAAKAVKPAKPAVEAKAEAAVAEVVEAAVETPVAEAPTPRRTAAAKANAPETTAEAPNPRRTAAAKATATEATAEAPKPRRRAAAKAEGDAAEATTEKKPRSRKKADTTEQS